MDLLQGMILQANSTIEAAANETVSAGTIKQKSTPEGMMVAYVSIVLMALIPIIIGSFKSVAHHHSQKEKSQVRCIFLMV